MKIVVPLVAASLIVAACGSSGSEVTVESASDPAGSSSPISTVESPRSVPPGSEPRAPQSQQPLAVSEGVQRAAVDADAPVAELTAGFNDAGFDLMRRMPAEDNLVFSPASIGHALLMAAAAGDDATSAAIAEGFGFPGAAHEAWNSIDQSIASAQSDRVTVTIADRIWPQIGLEPDQEWVDLLATQHGADVVALDLQGESDASRDVINAWVGDRTEGLIPDLLPEGFISGDTVLVLTDAVYFEADWAQPFGKYGSTDAAFTTLDGTEVATSFMRELELSDRRGVGDGFVGAEIPYAGGDYSMLVIVPDGGRYGEIRDRLDQSMLDEIDTTFTTGPYELLLPKWSDNSQIDLAEWLTEMGAAPGAYPKISSSAVLDGAVHAADIAVDEIGTIAAAATGLGFAESGVSEPELTIAADRPFIYLIRHRDSGLVLFAGHVTDPR